MVNQWVTKFDPPLRERECARVCVCMCVCVCVCGNFSEYVSYKLALYHTKKWRVQVGITNATGDVCYHLAESFASGEILGSAVDIDLALYEFTHIKSEMNLYTTEHDDTTLDGIAMELTDLAYPLLTTVTPTASAEVAFAGCCTIVLLDEVGCGRTR